MHHRLALCGICLIMSACSHNAVTSAARCTVPVGNKGAIHVVGCAKEELVIAIEAAKEVTRKPKPEMETDATASREENVDRLQQSDVEGREKSPDLLVIRDQESAKTPSATQTNSHGSSDCHLPEC